MTYTILKTPIGEAAAACSVNALTGFWFIGQKHFPADIYTLCEDSEHPVFIYLKSWLEGYFNGKNEKFAFKVKLAGTDFRQAVWSYIAKIPYGKTASYGSIAKAILRDTGKPASAIAVGNAVGKNPVSLIIPCHRVVGTDKKLTGYAGGLDRKEFLLGLEKADLNEFYGY